MITANSLASFVLLAALAGAELATAEEQEILQQSARSWGRGNTSVAAFDSDEATRANPATLAEPNLKFQMRWAQIDAFAGQNSLDTMGELSSIGGSSSGFGFLDKFRDKFGKRQYVRLQVAPLAMRIMSFEIAPFSYSDSYFDLRTPPLPEMTFRSDAMAGVNLSLGLPIGKTLAVGVTARPLYRWYFGADLAFDDVMDFIAPEGETSFDDYSTLRSGAGIGADVGGIWKPTPLWRFALLVQNVGDTGFFQNYGSEPPTIKQRLSLGMLKRWELSKTWHWDFLTDLSDLENRDGKPALRLLHLGTEIGGNVMTRDHDYGVMLGVNEGYFTGGVFADLWLVRLDLANYAVEVGEYPGQRMDRRWAMSMRTTTTF